MKKLIKKCNYGLMSLSAFMVANTAYAQVSIDFSSNNDPTAGLQEAGNSLIDILKGDLLGIALGCALLLAGLAQIGGVISRERLKQICYGIGLALTAIYVPGWVLGFLD